MQTFCSKTALETLELWESISLYEVIPGIFTSQAVGTGVVTTKTEAPLTINLADIPPTKVPVSDYFPTMTEDLWCHALQFLDKYR